MTDEEMAEQFAVGYYGNDAWTQAHISGSEIAFIRMCIADGFLAGLKSGRPKWHKVADGDLPRQDGHTCFSIEVLANNKKWIHYRFDSAKWFCGSKEVKVIAWCEIPQYKEAKEE